MQYERAAHFSKLHPTTDLTLQVGRTFACVVFFLIPALTLRNFTYFIHFA